MRQPPAGHAPRETLDTMDPWIHKGGRHTLDELPGILDTKLREPKKVVNSRVKVAYKLPKYE